jgi:hypothetical protein
MIKTNVFFDFTFRYTNAKGDAAAYLEKTTLPQRLETEIAHAGGFPGLLQGLQAPPPPPQPLHPPAPPPLSPSSPSTSRRPLVAPVSCFLLFFVVFVVFLLFV